MSHERTRNYCHGVSSAQCKSLRLAVDDDAVINSENIQTFLRHDFEQEFGVSMCLSI